MRIVVIGGTGLIGSKLVRTLTEHGHDAVAAAPSTGVNTYTGCRTARGLGRCIGGRRRVELAVARRLGHGVLPDRDDQSARRPNAAAGVTHHVALSVVGTASNWREQSGYFKAKLAQEKLISDGPIPYTIVHATQFFEFLATLADSATVGGTVALPAALFQPMAAADVARGVAIAAIGTPVNGISRNRRPAAVLPARSHPDGTDCHAGTTARSLPIPPPSTGAWISTNARSSRVTARLCSKPGSRTGSSKRPPRHSGIRWMSTRRSEPDGGAQLHRSAGPAGGAGARARSRVVGTVRIQHPAVASLRGHRRAAGGTKEGRRRAGLARGLPWDEREYEMYPRRNEFPLPRATFGFRPTTLQLAGYRARGLGGRQRAAIANWACFGAPAALFCYIDRGLGLPQWADLGMYLQTVMLLLRAEGLHSCPQMAWAQVAPPSRRWCHLLTV